LDGSVTVRFLKTESEQNFGFPHIPTKESWKTYNSMNEVKKEPRVKMKNTSDTKEQKSKAIIYIFRYC